MWHATKGKQSPSPVTDLRCDTDTSIVLISSVTTFDNLGRPERFASSGLSPAMSLVWLISSSLGGSPYSSCFLTNHPTFRHWFCPVFDHETFMSETQFMDHLTMNRTTTTTTTKTTTTDNEQAGQHLVLVFKWKTQGTDCYRIIHAIKQCNKLNSTMAAAGGFPRPQRLTLSGTLIK